MRGLAAKRNAQPVRRRGPLARWRWNRAAKLQSACRYIHKLRVRGLRMVEARRRAIERFDGIAIGDGRTLSLSLPTIERHFYRWIKAPSRAHFLSAPAGAPIDLESLKALVTLCLREAITLGEAYTRSAARARLPFCYHTALRHARELGFLEMIAQRRCLHRELASLEARAQRQTENLLRSLATK